MAKTGESRGPSEGLDGFGGGLLLMDEMGDVLVSMD